MNDFTKDELKELKIMAIHNKRDYVEMMETLRNIQIKIQSIIDNILFGVAGAVVGYALAWCILK